MTEVWDEDALRAFLPRRADGVAGNQDHREGAQ
jgi:hypothetical protein